MSCSDSACLTNALSGYLGSVLSSELVKEYKDMFIHVGNWARLQPSDLGLNDVCPPTGTVPEFVAEFERKLDGKPALAADVRYFVDLSVCFPFLMVGVGEQRLRVYHM
jgi:hypothetical protein